MGMQDALFRRFNFFSGIFRMSRRNLYDVFGYTVNPTFQDRFAKYLRQDVAARIVDAPAAALWSNPPQITATDAEWNHVWQDIVASRDLYAAIERVDKLAGIGRFAVLIIGFNDGNGLEMPVNRRRLARNEQKVLFLQPYSELSTKIVEFEDDSTNERFQKPRMYEIQPDIEKALGYNKTATKDTVGRLGSFKVHASRVLHIAENVLENDIYGSPRLERVYNILDDILKVTGGTAETFWLTSNRGLHVDVDKEMTMEPGDADALSDEIDEYSNNLRRVIRTRGVKVNPLGAETPDPRGAFDILISILSGATGIPRRILTGSEAGQLASEQDRANWADRIDERRANWANPIVLHQLIKLLTYAGALPSKEENKITIAWPSAFKMSPLEAAQTSAQHARSTTNFAKAIETMEKLKRGEPGSAGKTDAEGNPIPGTEVPAVEGVDVGDLVTVDEARKMIGLDTPPVTFDNGHDVNDPTKAKSTSVVPASTKRRRR